MRGSEYSPGHFELPERSGIFGRKRPNRFLGDREASYRSSVVRILREPDKPLSPRLQRMHDEFRLAMVRILIEGYRGESELDSNALSPHAVDGMELLVGEKLAHLKEHRPERPEADRKSGPLEAVRRRRLDRLQRLSLTTEDDMSPRIGEPQALDAFNPDVSYRELFASWLARFEEQKRKQCAR